MDWTTFVADNIIWAWLIVGLGLVALEITVPGALLIWMGVAAIATAILLKLFTIGTALQFALFGILAIVFVCLAVFFGKKKQNSTPEGQILNSRTAGYLGREVTLIDAIEQGDGRVQLDDSVWRVTGVDMPLGAKVRIVGARGAVLLVEPV